MKINIVQNRKGEYAIRRKGFLQKEEFLDFGNQGYWWNKDSSCFRLCCWSRDYNLVESLHNELTKGYKVIK